MTLATKLCEWVSSLAYEDLQPKMVHQAKMFFLDWLGSAIAGGCERPATIMLDLASTFGGKPEATILADGSKNSSLMAALVNGASSHVVEMDDLHRESIFHPAAAILPSVLAVAEQVHATGRRMILGIIAGYEVGIRVALGVGASHYNFWHTTATCGTFGAAAGAGKVLALETQALTWALGSAGTQAAGLWQFLVEGAMSKQLHTGKAALNGLLAALLAKRGFTGPLGILEGEKGFFRATSQDFDEERVLANLGHHYVLNGNSLKYHASCGHTHSAIDAVLNATGGCTLSSEDLQSIEMTTYQAALDLLQSVEPTTPYKAKFNLPFCVAVAIKFGKVGMSQFSEALLHDDEIRNLMAMVTLRSDPELSHGYPRIWPAKVTLRLRDGRILEGYNEHPKGDPENPITDKECIDKFESLTAPLVNKAFADAVVTRILNLEKETDVSCLLRDF